MSADQQAACDPHNVAAAVIEAQAGLDRRDWLRPSMLPKLALCGQYRPEADAGEYAERGTKLDRLFRDAVAGENISLGDLLPEDKDALRWAVESARALAADLPLFSSEEALRVEAMGLSGTADLLCEEGGWSADLKTGQKRNYVEQQALYALGFMDANFADEWTVYLLYCDIQEVETLRFRRDEATTFVRRALANIHEPAQVNEYCGWCAHRFDCAVRREDAALIVKDGAPLLESATSAQLRDFCLRAAVVEDFTEKAREVLKARMIAGEKVPGCSLTSRRGTRKVSEKFIELHLKDLGTGDVLTAYGPMSESKLLPIVQRKMPGREIPKEHVQEMPGSTFVRVGRPKL